MLKLNLSTYRNDLTLYPKFSFASLTNLTRDVTLRVETLRKAGRRLIREMVQIAVKIPGPDGQCSEWAMVELQGELETRHPVPLSAKLIGDLHFTHSDVPILIIGHHILYGKVIDLEKPFAVLAKDVASDSPMEDDVQETTRTSTEYRVSAIIKKKILFKTRPKPIIANVPKKL